MTYSDTFTLMTADRIDRALKRIAHEINEQNRADQPLLLIGINYRGYAVAKALGVVLSDIMDNRVRIEQLNLEARENDEWQQHKSAQDNEYFIVLVDDVIFSGRTMFRALTATVSMLNPGEIYTAALVDRGHRKYPVRAEFCGLKMPTKLDEHVLVEVEEAKPLEVRLIHK